MQPFYFFADLIDFSALDGKSITDQESTRRTVVVKTKEESAALAKIKLERLYKFVYKIKGEDKTNLIQATEDDWLEFQASIRKDDDEPYLVNPVSLRQPRESTLPDITGLKFADDMLTAIRKLPTEFSNPGKCGRVRAIDMWEFQCGYCGSLKPIRRSRVTAENGQKSCGCIKKDISKKNMIKANAAREKSCS